MYEGLLVYLFIYGLSSLFIGLYMSIFMPIPHCFNYYSFVVNFEVREGALTHWASQEMMEKFGAKRQPRGENFYTECVVWMHSAWPACSMGSDE